MLSNYLKIALRNLRRHKGYSFLNIAGLAVGLASSTLILLYAQSELSFDRYHSRSDRIFRIYKQDPGNVFLGTDRFAVTPAPLGPALEADFPEVEASAKFMGTGASGSIRIGEKFFFESGIYWAEGSIFRIFDFPLTSGNPETALGEPGTVVVSEVVARRLFDQENPIGKVIRVLDRYDMTVTGVMREVPPASHIVPSILLSFPTYSAVNEKNMNWGNSSYYTYVLLKEGAAAADVQGKLPSFAEQHMGELFKEWKREPTRFFLQPITDIHLFSTHINFGPGPGGNITTVYILLALAIVIVATAVINYMNLATARASLRAREVGVRKAIGAMRFELMRQFIGESLVYTGIAAGLAVLLVEIFLPAFSTVVGREFSSSLITDPWFMGGFIGLTIFVGVVAGSYPAFVLASFHPVTVLKGATRRREGKTFRNILVVAQFAASIALVVCMLTIFDQLRFIRTTDPGFNREQVLTLRLRGNEAVRQIPILKAKLLESSSIHSVSASTHSPINVGSQSGLNVIDDLGVERNIRSYQMGVDSDFLDVYRMKLIKGQFVQDGESPAGHDRYVVNETFVKAAGWADPIGKTFKRGEKTIQIIGVIKDFHLHSFHQAIAPLVLIKSPPEWGARLGVRVQAGQLAGAIAFIEQAWKGVVQDYPLDYAFLDESFNTMYQQEEKLGEVILAFTVLAILVGCLGLFGLAAFVAELRRKEIGIRKVLGATEPSVVRLLSREFLLLVATSNVVAWPVAYYLMDSWLQNFAYRTPLGPGLFLSAGILAMIIAFMTVSYQSIRAARTNPVEALRYE